MYECLIFDLDGTLVNTVGDIHAVLCRSLEKFNLPKITLEDTKKFVGNGAKKLVERAVGVRSDMLEKVYADYSKNFAVCENNLSELYEGEAEALENFKASGIKLALVTNKPQRATENVYKKFLSKYGFCKVVGQCDGVPLKPDPTSTLKIISELNVGEGRALFIGDGETDVLTAKAAQIDCVSVLWGYRTRGQLEAAGAEIFANNYGELSRIVLG